MLYDDYEKCGQLVNFWLLKCIVVEVTSMFSICLIILLYLQAEKHLFSPPSTLIVEISSSSTSSSCDELMEGKNA